MHWLGGVLESKGYSDLHVVDFYRDPTFLSEFATVDPSGDPPYFGSIRRMYTSLSYDRKSRHCAANC
jgi:hypothetical protein